MCTYENCISRVCISISWSHVQLACYHNLINIINLVAPFGHLSSDVTKHTTILQGLGSKSQGKATYTHFHFIFLVVEDHSSLFGTIVVQGAIAIYLTKVHQFHLVQAKLLKTQSLYLLVDKTKYEQFRRQMNLAGSKIKKVSREIRS